MTEKNKNDKIKVLHGRIKRIGVYEEIYTDPYLDDSSKYSFVENVLYDCICSSESERLFFEKSNEGKIDDELKKDIASAYELIEKYWAVLDEETMQVSYYPKIERKLIKIYERNSVLCKKLFPIVFFIIIDNIQELVKKSDSETYDYIIELLSGNCNADYIYSILDVDIKRKNSSGSKQRERFKNIFESSTYLEHNRNSFEDDYNKWNNDYIQDNEHWIRKVRSEYNNKYQKGSKERKSEKMYALFGFLSASWGREKENKWYSYDKPLTLFVINQMTSWLNLLFIHFNNNANYMCMMANDSLYSVLNYISEKGIELRNRFEETINISFFEKILDLSSVRDVFYKFYINLMNEEKQMIKKGLQDIAEMILKEINVYVNNPEIILTEEAINYVLYLYLWEDMQEEEYIPKYSYDEIIERACSLQIHEDVELEENGKTMLENPPNLLEEKSSDFVSQS